MCGKVSLWLFRKVIRRPHGLPHGPCQAQEKHDVAPVLCEGMAGPWYPDDDLITAYPELSPKARGGFSLPLLHGLDQKRRGLRVFATQTSSESLIAWLFNRLPFHHTSINI